MTTAKFLGTVLLALGALFAVLSGVPWASKADLAAERLRTDATVGAIQRSMDEIQRDVREIRALLLRRRGE